MKKSIVDKFSIDELTNIVKESNSLRDALRSMGLGLYFGNSERLKARLIKENIDFSHIKMTNKGRKFLNLRIPLSEIMVENSIYDNPKLKKRLVEEGILENKCACCGIPPIWNGKPLVLQLDHINGINNDHRKENVRLICPNCHTQTENWGNKGSRRIQGINKRKEKRHQKNHIDAGT